MNLKNMIAKHQLKGLIKQLETLDYDGIIDGVAWMGVELANEQKTDENDQYIKALYAIKECMIALRDIYHPEQVKSKEEGE